MRFLNLLINTAPKLVALSLLLTSCSSTSPVLPDEQERRPYSTSNSIESPSGEWPRQFSSEVNQITIYQPQYEKWSNHRFRGRAVASMKTPSSSQPVYGVVWMEAQTAVDPADQVVRFKDVQVSRADFPSQPELSQDALNTIRKNSTDLLKPIELDRFRSQLMVSEAEEKHQPPTLRNDPPKILFSKSPSILILIDSKPVLRETEDQNILRVINTRALMLLDSSHGKYYLHLGKGWMEAKTIKGPWNIAKNPPSSLEEIKRREIARKEVDLLDDSRSPIVAKMDEGVTPNIYVSTEPAVLLQTQGAPDYKSISNTHLLYVDNTEDTILLNERDQNYYVLLSGRWYRAKSLTGPWKFISARRLPSDFAKIPENHRKGTLLASVAGTPQAREAAISNEVPQTAKVNRRKARLDVEYDGTPQFKLIQDTPLRYAINSAIPVIEVNSHSYYALQAGVWFKATSPEGPWSVATRIPPVIYTIPPSSPVYSVTYVRIYDQDPEFVYMGYTPGYLGSYYCSDGVVVFGTGYPYSSWIGTTWIGPPWTVGFGWGFSSWGWGYYPWWAPWQAGIAGVYYPPSYPVSTSSSTTSPPNIYQGWSSTTVTSSNPDLFNTPYVAGAGRSQSSAQGNSSGWQTYQPGTVSQSNESARVEAYTGQPPTGTLPQGSRAGEWGPAVQAPPPAQTAVLPPPPPPPPAPAAPAGGHAGAVGQAMPGGGWGRAK